MKINGVEIFVGLLTVTNEKGEMRVCNLVATKAHSQFELGLKRMQESLVLFGHKQPHVFYTDNMADKAFLESSFPSLRENITPIEKYAHLPLLTIPNDWTRAVVRNTPAAITTDILRLVDQIPTDGQKLTVGFDTEWNVDLSAGSGHQRSHTAIIQIAYDRQIYIFQIGHMLEQNTLPAQLIAFLANPQVQKAGRQVQVDLRALQRECGSHRPFVGGVDLAQLAKERQVVAQATVSLSDLCAVVLKSRLNKNVPTRVSAAWEAETLSDAHIQYAALDAYASLRIYEELVKIPAPGILPGHLLPSQPVILYQSDHTRVIAKGVISPHATDSSYDSINITPTRTVILVQEVLVPGAIISTHGKRTLSSFMPSETDFMQPFHLVCLRSHLRTAPTTVLRENNDLGSQTPSGAAHPSQSTVNQLPTFDITEIDVDFTDENGDGIGDLMRSSDTDDAEHNLPNNINSVVDPVSHAEGQQVLASTVPNAIDLRTVVHSRVLKDPFHIFNMFYISRTHGLRVAFAQALRDAIFIPDDEDMQRITIWGAAQEPPVSWETLRRTRSTWLWRHCKRVIPPPEDLYEPVQRVFQTYGPLQDAKTSSPLFNAAAWKIAKNILLLIQQGYVSDPPDVPLYFQLGLDSKAGNLPVYRCIRGTNNTEGGVHKHIRRHLPQSGVSIRHISAALTDFTFHHNLTVSLTYLT